MNEVAKSDIFFVITTIAVVVVTVVFVVALLYLIKILRDFKQVSGRVKEESDRISKDLSDLHTAVREQGARVAQAVSSFGSKKKRNAPKKETKEDVE
ncbi:MAG: hypothetical protein A2408_00205 [Candidatus Yonathbacteria bacterium RIFOXYC1_FULL_52_10]|uniref:Uncharacterized protein n=1 Tax=Candidatus Yonathbacteria bacterium RIFOXYD1_FULL_52_36 TaxID=1802730 RepID=A0A1G2SMB5_9BACT|nr:MAG: hypothetical protein A2408_00205 [Candidatus Yonathbacteria bacterium RIFOXYC1_FULL_52_10]OHA85809.1 MAG: hypothetical protein A2591_00490 [Candidatus Yonathbacteria bacterium RIFOXYD1_FULL_52_36]